MKMGKMNNIAEFLTYGIGLPELDEPPQKIDGGATCAITGEKIDVGYPVMDIISKSTGEYLDLLGGYSSEWLSEAAARAFKGSWNMGSRLVFADGTHYHPLVARDEAKKQNRACWSDLVREIWPDRAGQSLVMILTTDFKKRIWPRGRVGILRDATNVLVHDMQQDIFDVLQINWPRLLETLEFVEEVCTAGFPKYKRKKSGVIIPIMPICILTEVEIVENIGLQSSMKYEAGLRKIRQTNEFKIAMIIAQKQEGIQNDENYSLSTD